MSVELQGMRQRSGVYENTSFPSDPEDSSFSKDAKSDSGYDGFKNQGYEGSMSGTQASIDMAGKDPDAQVEDEEEDDDPNCFIRAIKTIQDSLGEFYVNYHTAIWRVITVILILLYAAYFGYAMYYSFDTEGTVRLLWVTCVVVFCVVVYYIFKLASPHFEDKDNGYMEWLSKHNERISWIVVALIYLAFIIFVIVDVAYISKNPYNLVSGAGIIFYVLMFFIFSYNPAKVKWRPVAWGLALQFVFALLILRWDRGFKAFEWLGDRVTEFLRHTDAGAEFVFGTDFRIHFFAFAVLPTVVFFSTVIAVLYYLGAMQVIIKAVASVMQACMATTAAESLNAAGNIFIGQSEAPLMIRPLLKDMTRSEIHAVMTGGFATIAGTVLAAYIEFGAPANHLLSASVMSAPAALAMSKLFYPETEKSKTTAADVKAMESSPARNILEAASAGASQSVKLVGNIAANLIAFISLLAFINATLTWFGERVGMIEEPLTFEFLCSYLLWPLSLVMGVEVLDCRKVAELIGVKTFLNEFVAFARLGVLIDNREHYNSHINMFGMNGTSYQSINDVVLVDPNFGNETTLIGGFLADRSEVIATYALCGFSNFGSIGIQLGALGAMAPSRKSDLARIVLRAMIAGNVACFMTACIAGLLYQAPV